MAALATLCDAGHHFIREKVASGEVKLSYFGSLLQLADILTKALPAPKFQSGSQALGLED